MTFSINDLLWLLPVFLLLIVLLRITSGSNKGIRNFLLVAFICITVFSVYFSQKSYSSNELIHDCPTIVHPDEFNTILMKDWNYMAGVLMEKGFIKEDLPLYNDKESIKKNHKGLLFKYRNPKYGVWDDKKDRYLDKVWVWEHFKDYLFYGLETSKQLEDFFNYLPNIGGVKLDPKNYTNYQSTRIAYIYKDIIFVKVGFVIEDESFNIDIIKKSMLIEVSDSTNIQN